MGNLEIIHSGPREEGFLLYCISEVENEQYIVFTLKVESLMEPFTAPNREAAIQNVKQFFYDAKD